MPMLFPAAGAVCIGDRIFHSHGAGDRIGDGADLGMPAGIVLGMARTGTIRTGGMAGISWLHVLSCVPV